MFLPSNITLQFGDSGDFVGELQRRLAMVDCHPPDQINSFYDGVTVNSVSRFQSMRGLRSDGVAGPETLRMLNGMVSGGSGSNDTKQEEEAAKAAATDMTNNFLLHEAQAHTDPSLLSPDHAPAEMVAEPAPSLIEAPAPLSPEPSTQSQNMSVSEQMIRDDFLQQEQRTLTTHELLMAQLQHPPSPEPKQFEQVGREDQLLHRQHPPKEPLPPKAEAAPTHPPRETAPPPVPEPQAQGVVGKTIRFTNATLQKIAEYIESKLHPSVLREVQDQGQRMAQNGVKEAPIPMGPEQMRPTEQLPTRGPEQQPQQR
jgi:hypothetical protein